MARPVKSRFDLLVRHVFYNPFLGGTARRYLAMSNQLSVLGLTGRQFLSLVSNKQQIPLPRGYVYRVVKATSSSGRVEHGLRIEVDVGQKQVHVNRFSQKNLVKVYTSPLACDETLDEEIEQPTTPAKPVKRELFPKLVPPSHSPISSPCLEPTGDTPPTVCTVCPSLNLLCNHLYCSASPVHTNDGVLGEANLRESFPSSLWKGHP